MIQTPMVGLVAIGLWLMVARIEHPDSVAAVAVAWLARTATFVFLIYYTVLDAIGGIGLGRTIVTTESLAAAGKLSAEQVDGIVLLLDTVWTGWLGRRGRFVRQSDRILGGVRGGTADRCRPAAGAACAVAAACAAGRVRLGAADQSRQPARTDRVCAADRRIGLDVVGGTAPRGVNRQFRGVRRTVGAGMLSIITLMHAGLPLASERSIAPGISSALCTSSPCPPSAATTRSYRVGSSSQPNVRLGP